MLGGAYEICGKLGRSQACAFPFRYRFAFLLVSLLHHQIHRFLFVHVPCVNALVENGIADGAQPHLQLLHFHLGPAITLFRHHLFTINGPTLDECAALKNRAHQSGRAESVGPSQLQEMSRHSLKHGQIANHVIVVLAEE